LIILQVLLNNTGTVTRILGNQGLDNWFRRASVLNGLGGRMEEWYSTTTKPVSNPAIYVTETLSKITIATQEFAFSGYDVRTPFDPNLSTPSNATGNSDTISTTISTNHSDDIVLGFSYGGGRTISAGPTFSPICLNASPCQFDGIATDASEYEGLTRTQSNYNVSMIQTAGTSWGFIADAIQSSSPTVASIFPTKGITGTTVTITGVSFLGTINVQFCGTPQPAFNVLNDSAITTVAPQITNPSSSQSCDIVVTNGGGSSSTLSADQFSYLPSIITIDPATGSVGASLRITGSSFIGTTSVVICGVSQSKFTVASDTQIMTTVPEAGLSASRRCDVTVTNLVGTSRFSGTDSFTFVPQSTIPRSPPSSPTSGKILYIEIASVAAVALIVGSQFIHRRDSGERQERQPQSRERPAGTSPRDI
jgi:hypothetical protein